MPLSGVPVTTQGLKFMVVNNRYPAKNKVMGGAVVPLATLAVAPRHKATAPPARRVVLCHADPFATARCTT